MCSMYHKQDIAQDKKEGSTHKPWHTEPCSDCSIVFAVLEGRCVVFEGGFRYEIWTETNGESD